jgi:hypothetical protein
MQTIPANIPIVRLSHRFFIALHDPIEERTQAYYYNSPNYNRACNAIADNDIFH